MRVHINRILQDTVQTLGEMKIFDSAGKEVFKCKTMELGWNDNKRRVSCIPKGQYRVIRRFSPKYGRHFHILNVPGRDMILIHVGNYHSDLLGCIAPGASFHDLNKDGLMDVTSSKVTMDKLNNLLPDAFLLTIE